MASPSGDESDNSVEAPSQLLLMKDESIISFFRYSDIISDFAKEHCSIGRIEEVLNEKFLRVTSVCKDAADWPIKYYHHSPQSRPQIEYFSPVVYIGTPVNVVTDDVKSKWLALNEAGQDKLYMLLTTGITLWHQLRYYPGVTDQVKNETSCKWRKQEGPDGKALHTILQRYGDKMPPRSTDVLTVLSRGRSKLEMKNCLRAIQDGNIGDTSIAHAWERALASDMSNGSGRLAVFMLLDAIIGLRHGLTEEFTHVEILNITSPLADDGFSISTTTPSKVVTRFSLSALDPNAASQKSERPQKRLKRPHSDSSSDEDGPKLPGVNEGEAASRAKLSQTFVDLKVASYSPDKKSAKYIILIEIHSKGKTLEQAKQKFMKELIHILQSQNVVFGLFFGTSQVILYKARRSDNDDGQQITIERQEYTLFEAHSQGAYVFSVCKFQKLVMDLFSCILDGLANIEHML